MDGDAVAEGIAQVHSETASILKYNDGNSLKCTVLMAYFSARAYYLPPNLELPSGKRYADWIKKSIQLSLLQAPLADPP